MEEVHSSVAQKDGYHSEIQLGLTGLLGMEMRVRKTKRWKYPFGYYPVEFDNYSEVADHVLHARTHKDYEEFL
jgi:hypothetical protein